MNIKRLNTRGFAHHIVLAAFVVVFAVAGVGYIVASHAATPCVKHTFKQGARGGCVKAIQFSISYGNNIGFKGLPVDGVYGSNTKAGVKAEQRTSAIKMPATGTVDKLTWNAVCGRLSMIRVQNKPSSGLAKKAQYYWSNAGCNIISG